MKNTNKKNQNHFPVLLNEVLSYLNPQEGESYLDCTAGYGGHASAVLERTLRPAKAVLVDRDQKAVDYLTASFSQGTKIIQKDFLSAAKELQAEDNQFDLILADLGVSSPHLDIASRGFSLQNDGPLDMRMDQTQELTADQVVNSYEEAKLAQVIRRYGEEPKAKKIAAAIVGHRPIKGTKELASVIAQSIGQWKPGRSRVHPATRAFQAIRIEVNSELELLQQTMPVWIDLLTPGGRIVVISFHSLEDRLVKQLFKEYAGNRYDATLKLLTNRPVVGSNEEIEFNPRARSAKLRAAAKINTKRRE